jgi:hypothetical protein
MLYRAKLFQGFFYFTGDLGMIMHMIHNFNSALKEAAVPEAVEDDLVHIGLVVVSLLLTTQYGDVVKNIAVPINLKSCEY